MHVSPVHLQMGLLNDAVNIENRVKVGTRRREAAQRRCLAGKEVHQLVESRARAARVDHIGKGVKPPATVSTMNVPQVNLLGITESDHLGRIESTTWRKTSGQFQIFIISSEQSRHIVGGKPGGKLAVGNKLALHLGQSFQRRFGVVSILGGSDRPRPTGIHLDQIFRNNMTLFRSEERRVGKEWRSRYV